MSPNVTVLQSDVTFYGEIFNSSFWSQFIGLFDKLGLFLGVLIAKGMPLCNFLVSSIVW